MPANDEGRRSRPLTAKNSDKLRLYEMSVQAPEVDSRFFARYYRRIVGRPARVFREDFCGTAILACHWVKLHRENRALAIDLHGPTLDWGRRHNVDALTADQRARIRLIQDDVRNVRSPKAHVVAALNFSYSCFKTRAELGGYFASSYRSLADDGLFMVDVWGGSEVQVLQEEERPVDGFSYVWDQAAFDPLTHDITCRIHFRFKDGSRMRNAFVYDWRLWTLPELRELMAEAGFRDIHVLWEGTDHATDEGNGVFRRVKRGEPDLAWIAYVVGQR